MATWACLVPAPGPAAWPPEVLWARQSGSSGAEECRGQAVAADPAGHCYVAGYFSGTSSFGLSNLVSNGDEDMFLAKYDAQGNLLWTQRAGGVDFDQGRSVAVDETGGAVATGFFQRNADFGGVYLSSAGESDVFVAKYASDGALVWARRAGGRGFDEARSVALDANGGIYLTGYFDETASFGTNTLVAPGASNNLFVAHGNGSGDFVWATAAGGVGEVTGHAIALDAAANVYVAGAFAGTINFGTTNLSSAGNNQTTDLFVAKYDPTGHLLWVRSAGGTNDDAALGLSATAAGDLYVTGHIYGPASFGTNNVTASRADIFVARYTTGGEVLWVRRAGGNNVIYGDNGYGVQTDAEGNAFVTGYFSSTASFGSTNVASSGFHDIFVSQFSPSGEVTWVWKAGGTDVDVGLGICLDPVGHPYVTGFFSGTAHFGAIDLVSQGPSTSRDVFVAKLATAARPALAISGTAGWMTLSWPAAAAEFVPEATRQLPAVLWEPVNGSVTESGNSRMVSFPTNSDHQFFRLRKQ